MFKFIYHILKLITKTLLNFKKSIRQTIHLMNEFEQKYNGKFSNSLVYKTSRYEGVQQIVINDAFTRLVGRNTTAFERESNKLFFIITFLYDDIMDQKILTEDDLNQLLENPEENPYNIFEAKVLVDIHLQLLQRTKQPEKYKAILLAIHKAQKDSLNQLNKQINESELLDITLRKGGYSFFLCSLYIDLPISIEMDHSWYQIGGMMQMIDDMFDIHNDVQDGIQTYPNTTLLYHDLENTFIEIVMQLRAYIKDLPFGENKKKNLFLQLSIIPAFGYLALDHLKKLQDEHGRFKKFSSYPRKLLIIDMEKIRNIARLILHAYKIGKSWK